MLIKRRPAHSLWLMLFSTCVFTIPACRAEPKSFDDSTKAIGRAVLTYLIEEKFGTDGEPEDPTMLVVSAESKSLQKDEAYWISKWAYVRGEKPHSRAPLLSLRDDTCVSFVKANERSHDLTKSLDAPLPIVFLRKNDLSQLENMRVVAHDRAWESSLFWQAFHVRYPRGYALISLSRPGVSDDGMQAVIWVSMERGSLSAWGGYALVERTGRDWSVKGLCVTVVS